jgi:type I restriction enzyme S subunit
VSDLSFLETLLNGAEIEWKPLEKIAEIKHGKDWKNLTEGDVPVYGSGGIMGYVDTFAHDRPTVLIPRKGSITNVFYVDTPFWNVDTIFYTDIRVEQVVPRYLYHFVKTVDLMALNTGSGRPSLTQAILNKLLIPIPCPENPGKSLEIQGKIVRVLDRFAELTAELTVELTAELGARKKQYSHYRDQLLTSGNGGVEWLPMEDIGEFIRGKRFTKADYRDDGIRAIHYGEIYTHYGMFAYESLSKVRADMANSLRFAEKNDVVVAGVSETLEDVGKAVAWLGEGKVAIHDDSYAFRHAMNPKYIAYAMQIDAFHDQKGQFVSRGKIKRLLIDGMKKVKLPIPFPDAPQKSLAEQARIVAILDKFGQFTSSIGEDFPREIALRKKQYEYYRDLIFGFPKAAKAAEV